MKRIALLFAALLAYAGLSLAAVNINSGTKEMLEALDGIGPVKAQAIIDYRKKNGSFKRLEELKNVDGIGEVTFEKIRRDIALTGTSTMPKPADPPPAAPPKADTKPAPAPKADAKMKADDKKADAKAKVDDKKAKVDDKKSSAMTSAEEKKAKAKADADEKKAKA
ncbi:MAG: helix-hairpin-helix domain-containing protein, partial [Usitatibacter sp.]